MNPNIKPSIRSLVLAVSLVFTSFPLLAAGPTGSIVGTVLDSSGAAVADAKVIVTAPATGFIRTVTSSADGGYVCALLPVGVYQVSIESQGFKKFEQSGVEVKAEISTSVFATLRPGSTSETITVQGEASQVDTRTGTLRETIDQRTIQDLPLDGRNAAQLVLLSPGTSDLTNGGNGQASSGGSGAGVYGDLDQPVTYPGAQYISSNGAQGQGVNYLLDGGTNVDVYSNVNNPFPNPEALEEFTVQTNNYSAEYGRGVGAVVNIVTKSGTNALHGNLFEFLRNGAFNAANYFSGGQVDQLKRNQFGGSLGGAIIKNRLFFFGNYQGTVEHNSTSGSRVRMLTQAERIGDFGALLTQGTQLVDPETGNPFPGNQIPSGQLDNTAKGLLAALPLPNTLDPNTGIVDLLTYGQPGIRNREQQALGRVDYQTEKNRLSGRYFYTHWISDANVSSTNLLQARPGQDFTYQALSGSDTYAFSPTLINTFLVSYDRNAGNTGTGAPFGLDSLGSAIPAPTNTAPEIRISVGSGLWSIETNHFRQINRASLQFADTVHWVRGKHEIAVGGDYIRQTLDEQNAYYESGRFRFDRDLSGSPLADLVLGAASRFQQGGGEWQNRTGNLFSLFANDSYRVLRNLTVNLGLRLDPFLPFADSLGRTECYRPGLQSTRFPNAPLGYLFAGDTGCPDGGFNSSLGLVSPRVGFSYDLRGDGKTVVRGGAGYFTQPPFMNAFNDFSDSEPFSPQFDLRSSQGVSLSDPYGSQGIVPPFPERFSPFAPLKDVDFSTQTGGSVTGRSYTANWKPMQLWSWNLTVERQLQDDLIARIGYVGSKGTHLAYNIDANAAFNGGNVPDPNFGVVTESVSGGNSIYHSLQLSLEKRFSKGFSLATNYSWNHNNDWVSYQSDTDSINVINPFAPGAYAGTSDLEIRHRLTLRGVWEIPGPTAGLMRGIFGGWQTSGIWSWQSGTPFSIFCGCDNAGSGIGNDLADQIGPVHYISGSMADRLQQWFSIDSFTQNAPGTFGDSRRNILRGPRYFNVDLSLRKRIALTERMNLEFRAEFFNVLNHPNFGLPDNFQQDGDPAQGGSFGVISSAAAPRIGQLALKFTF